MCLSLTLAESAAEPETSPETTDPPPETEDEVDEPADEAGGEAGTVLLLEIVDGELAGGPRQEAAPLGEEVTIRVSGDASDHVHIHGYDLFIDLAAGEEELTFTADIPGVFEIELEEAGVLLVRLEVS